MTSLLSHRRGFLAGTAVAAALIGTRAVAATPAGCASCNSDFIAGGSLQAPWTDGGVVRRAGGFLSWRAIGPETGEPVVLLHKLGGWVADWRAVVPYLGERYRVIAFDLPGHGESAMLGPPPYIQTVGESAAMILAALSELGIDKFTVAGNSLGGVIGIQLAARWPERIRALVLASVSLYAGQTREELVAAEKNRDPEVWTDDWRPLPRTMEQVARFGSVDPAVEIEQNASRARADYWVRPSERGVALVDTEAALRRTSVPLLMIYADRGYYTRYVDLGREVRPDAEIVQLSESGSFVHQEKPAETAAAMLAFLDRLP